MKTKVLVIVGPTASGKSDLAIELALKLGGEIISADSRQVYKGLDIGTGKITTEEMRGVPHHLLDVASSKIQFTAQDFVELAERAIADISSRGKLPIICGGTGFYIDALVNSSAFPAVKADKRLRARLAKRSAPELLVMLARLDPLRARQMAVSNSERNNARRLIRAIEVATTIDARNAAGTKKEERQTTGNQLAADATGRVVDLSTPLRIKYDAFWIGIKPNPEELKRRIHDRLVRRLDAGMIDETCRLHERGLSWKRMNELGLEYRYLARFLQKKMTKDSMIAKLEVEINRYAKRQMTWFKRNIQIRWFSSTQEALTNVAIQSIVG